jgi:hypothetical protein
MRATIIVTAVLIALISTPSLAADRTSFGLGLGSLYNGLGVNIAWTAPDDMKYLAGGCSGYSHSSIDGTNLRCGAGFGWLRTDILTRKNDRHGLGLNIALEYDQQTSDAVPILRVPYVFFFNGINQKGLNIGVAPSVAWEDGGADFGALIQIGYQF